jgi:adenylate cyclase
MLDWVAVYGRTEGIAIYELLAMTGAPERFAWVKDYEAGLAAYRARRWEEATHLFTAANAAHDGGDRPSQIFIERCRALLINPPGADWTPVAVLMEK